MQQHAGGNQLHLSGRVQGTVEFSHAVGDTAFCRFFLAVTRMSGTLDVLPVTANAHLLPPALKGGDPVRIEGQLRAYRRCLPDGAARVFLTAFARHVEVEMDAADANEVQLTGRLARHPVYRETPSRREIADVLLLVPRAFGRLDGIPVIAWGRFARFAATLAPDTPVAVQGRFQSRAYQKRMPDGTVLPRTAYEVSASALTVPAEDPD